MRDTKCLVHIQSIHSSTVKSFFSLLDAPTVAEQIARCIRDEQWFIEIETVDGDSVFMSREALIGSIITIGKDEEAAKE